MRMNLNRSFFRAVILTARLLGWPLSSLIGQEIYMLNDVVVSYPRGRHGGLQLQATTSIQSRRSGTGRFPLHQFLIQRTKTGGGAVDDAVVIPQTVHALGSSSRKIYPANSADYNWIKEVGDGASATVYMTRCTSLDEVVAIKVLDLEKSNNSLDRIQREVRTMSLIEHPNVVKSYCSFSTGTSLWIAMPYMPGGSSSHIMRSSYPEGFEEPVIAILLYEVFKALAYLHSVGLINRDVKACNILLDSIGAVNLGDFGVSADMFDSRERQNARRTFTGTPYWMAPEVMEPQNGYDFK